MKSKRLENPITRYKTVEAIASIAAHLPKLLALSVVTLKRKQKGKQQNIKTNRTKNMGLLQVCFSVATLKSYRCNKGTSLQHTCIN